MAGRQIRKTRKSSWKVDKAPSARREVVLSKFQKMAPAEVEEWGRVRKQVIESLTHKLGPATRAQIAEAERQADIALRVKNPHYYPDVDLGLRRVGVFPLAEASHKKAQLIEKGVAGVQIRRHGVSSKYEVWVPRGEERIRAAEGEGRRVNPAPRRKGTVLNNHLSVPGLLYLYEGMVYYAHIDQDGRRVQGVPLTRQDEDYEWDRAYGSHVGSVILITVPFLGGREIELPPVGGEQRFQTIEEVEAPAPPKPRAPKTTPDYKGYFVRRIRTSFGWKYFADRNLANVQEDTAENEAEYSAKDKTTLYRRLDEAGEQNPGRPPHLPMGKPLDIYMNEVIVVPGFPQYRARRGTIAQVLQQKYNTQQLNYMVWSKPALAGEPNIETAEELEDLYRQSNPQSRFEKLTHQLEKRGAESPRALAAWIGRRKYGAAGFQKMAQAGRRAARAHSNPAFSEAMFGTVKDVAKHKQSGPYRIYYPLPVASLLEAHDKREHTEQETGVDWAVFEYNRRFGIIPLEWLVDARMFLKAHAAPSQCDLQTGEVREAASGGKGLGAACRTFYRELTRMENPSRPVWQMTRDEIQSGGWDVNLPGGSGPGEHTLNLEVAHRAAIRKALREGKPIPPEVLADYPDLERMENPTPEWAALLLPGPGLADEVALAGSALAHRLKNPISKTLDPNIHVYRHHFTVAGNKFQGGARNVAALLSQARFNVHLEYNKGSGYGMYKTHPNYVLSTDANADYVNLAAKFLDGKLDSWYARQFRDEYKGLSERLGFDLLDEQDRRKMVQNPRKEWEPGELEAAQAAISQREERDRLILEAGRLYGDAGQRTLEIALRRNWLNDQEAADSLRIAEAIYGLDPGRGRRTVHLAEAVQYKGLNGLQQTAQGLEYDGAAWVLGSDPVPGRNLSGPDSPTAKRAKVILEAAGI